MRGVLLLAFAGCKAPPSGTFVGNPTLKARYVDNNHQVGLGGELVTLETAVEPCAGATVDLGPQTYVFDGTEATVSLELPEEELCSLRLVVKTLTIEALDGEVQKSVTGQDFDLDVPADAIPAGASSLELRLGDANWLPSFMPLASAGLTVLNSEAPADLVEAFFDGLNEGSAFDVAPPR